jgi:hypothetical protein
MIPQYFVPHTPSPTTAYLSNTQETTDTSHLGASRPWWVLSFGLNKLSDSTSIDVENELGWDESDE